MELYEEISRILKAVKLKVKNSSLRNLVFSSKLKNKKEVFRLCYETLTHEKVLEKIVSENKILRKVSENFSNRWLLYVHLYEYLFGSRKQFTRKGEFQLKKAITKQTATLLEAKCRLISEGILSQDGKLLTTNSNCGYSPSNLKLPRYARINTLKIDRNSAIEALKEQGYEFVETNIKEFSRRRFRNFVSQLFAANFCLDKDIEDLLIFPHATDLHDNPLVRDGSLLLQDKASCLPSSCLYPEPGSSVLDACAAPGMKTSHMAVFMKNKGQILAIDKTEERVETMKSLLKNAGVSCVKVQCADFLRADLKDKKFSKIKFALVDPPCSGSGIVSRMDYLTDEEDSKSAARLNSLGNLQAMLLKHAMRLPNVQKVVYSTCSVYERENEVVVEEVLNDQNLSQKFHLIQGFPRWKHRGRRNYEFGRMCLRSSPEKDLTNGFFVAVFERKIK